MKCAVEYQRRISHKVCYSSCQNLCVAARLLDCTRNPFHQAKRTIRNSLRDIYVECSVPSMLFRMWYVLLCWRKVLFLRRVPYYCPQPSVGSIEQRRGSGQPGRSNPRSQPKPILPKRNEAQDAATILWVFVAVRRHIVSVTNGETVENLPSIFRLIVRWCE